MRSQPGGLPWVAMGLIVLVLTVPVGGYDLLADPLGWVMVGYGVAGLRLDPTDRSRLLGVVWLAVVVSAVVWPAPVAGRLADADPSLAWAVSLPGIGVAVLLAGGLATLARRAGAAGPARWWEVARTLSVVAGVLPVLVFGGHLDALDATADVVSVVAPGLLVVLCLRYARRPWAAVRDPQVATDPVG